jgi:hypothetical protein
MTKAERLAAMRERATELNAVEMAEYMAQLVGEPVNRSMVAFNFVGAFAIPLSVVRESLSWQRLNPAAPGLSDDEFNRMLAPWLPRRTPD